MIRLDVCICQMETPRSPAQRLVSPVAELYIYFLASDRAVDWGDVTHLRRPVMTLAFDEFTEQQLNTSLLRLPT